MSTAVAKKPLRQVSNVRELLVNDMAKQQLATVAARHMRPERMMRIMAGAIRTTPQLAECDPLSLLGAMMTAASLGLEPQTPLGHCYLIPFKNRRKNITEVQFIIGWRGMIALARRSGAVVSIHADVVYQNDEFSFEYGSNQHLRHKPTGERANPQYAYCYAKLTDGEAFIVLPWPEIMKTRDNSQGYQTAKRYGKLEETPWVKHEHAMAKKTAVRRLFDELPISIEDVSEAIEIDEQRNDFSTFALHPENGGPEVEGETIEGDYTEGDTDTPDDGDTIDSTATEEKPKQESSKPKTQEKPVSREKVDYNPADEAKEKSEDTAQDPEKSAHSDEVDPSNPKHIKIKEQIEGDLTDGAPVDELRRFYEADLDAMKAEAPDLRAEVEKMLNEAAG